MWRYVQVGSIVLRSLDCPVFSRKNQGDEFLNGLLTPEEVAEKVKVDIQTVRVWLRAKKLKGIKMGRLWRVKEADLNQFLNGGSQATKVKATARKRI